MNTFIKILGPIGIIYFALAFIGANYVNSDNPAMPTASASPEEGEPLDKLKTYLLIVNTNQTHSKEHVRIETTLELSDMSEEDIINSVTHVVEIGDNDSVEVIDLSLTERVVL
jgi:hypothetical protein